GLSHGGGRSIINRLAQAISSGAITPDQLRSSAVAACRSRVGSSLNAFVSLAEPQHQPPVANRGHGSPLFGLPIAVKDNFCTAGCDTPGLAGSATCGSPTLADNFLPSYTATSVRRLLDEGAWLLGKTNLDPFGMGSGCSDGLHGPVRNPWRSPVTITHPQSPCSSSDAPDSATNFYIAGGSSGGSAAAVASGLAVGALASDTGGSSRIPAAFCGIVGLKPTYGRVSRHGLVPLVNALDCVSIMANTVADACLLLNAMQGPDENDSTCCPERPEPVGWSDKLAAGLKIGVPAEFSTPGMSASVLDTWSRAVTHLESDLGLTCLPVSLPHTPLSIKAYSVLCCAEVASNMARYDGIEFGLRVRDSENSVESLYTANRLAGFNSVIRSRVLAGNYFLLRRNYKAYYEQARKVWRLIKEDFDRVFQSVDLLVCPAAVTAAPTYRDFVQADNRYRTSTMDLCTQSVNLAGLPSIVLPTGLEEGTGLPLAVQVIGPAMAEARVAALAARLESWARFPLLAESSECSLLRLLD
uniref:Glutamyl-tRNA(Gln) amidotransferase subunit A, mitochondrial n=1 Tax=Macrostomum lignano TaxID=282301 RepID=A0A1I8IIA2_9PLAT